jgi:hypothetical protein
MGMVPKAYHRYDDPKGIWENLTHIHQSQGFGTLLSMHCRFCLMVKDDKQPMQAWIAAVKHATFDEATDFEVCDIDLIIALTQGLPDSYSSFIVSLNATPPNQLNVDSLIVHLLNEETCQLGSAAPVKTESDAAFYVGGAQNKHGAQTMHNVWCFNCHGFRYLSHNCPSPKHECGTAAAATYDSDTNLDDDLSW